MTRSPGVRTTTVVAAAAVVATSVVASPAGGDETEVEEHCVVHVIGQEESGEYLLDEPDCYPTLEEALAAAGGQGQRAHFGATSAAQTSSISLAVHFDGANYTGSSITVSGAACDGGYVNLSSAWINRISSTWNACPIVNFFDGYDKSGTYESTSSGAHNLATHSNLANSVGYAS